MRDGASLVPLWEKDKLADDVVEAFKDYPVDQLDKMWRYKACVVDRVGPQRRVERLGLSASPHRRGEGKIRRCIPSDLLGHVVCERIVCV